MSNSDLSRPKPPPESKGRRASFLPSGFRSRRVALAAALAAACAVGVGGGALALRGRQPVLVSLAPAPISAMQDWSPVAVKGQVAEIFGNTFIIQDSSGRALVETGPKGDGGALVAKSETVTVQGRFERGLIHAAAITHPDGRNDFVGPPDPPPHGRLLSWRGLGDFFPHLYRTPGPRELDSPASRRPS